MSTFQHKLNCANPFSCSWDISRQSFYSYWWPDISVICCHFCTSHIYADSSHLVLSSATYFVKISLLVVEIQAEWSLWHFFKWYLSNRKLRVYCWSRDMTFRWCLLLILLRSKWIGIKIANASILYKDEVWKILVIHNTTLHCIFFNSLRR